MSNTSVQGLIRQTSEAIPGMAIAVAGVSLAIYAFESNRMASFQNVPSASATSSISLFATVVVLGLLAFFYRAHPSLRIHRRPVCGFAIAGLLSASLLLMAETTTTQPSQVYAVFSVISSITKSLLLLCWIEVLCAFRGRQYATILALAICGASILNGFSAFIKQDAVVVLVSMMPLLSIACLYWLKDRQESFDVPTRFFFPNNSGIRKDVLKAPGPYSQGLFLVFLAPLACYTFSFGFIHYAWVPFQDGSNTSMLIQMAAALGTFLASLFLLLLIAYFWGPKKLELYNIFILFLLGVTLYVTTMFQGMMPGFYVVPLNIAQKMTLFLVLLAPFLVSAKRSSLSLAAIASGLYTLGRATSTLAAGHLNPSIYSMIVLGTTLIAAIAVIAGVMINGNVSNKTPADTQNLNHSQESTLRLYKAPLDPLENLMQPYEGLRGTASDPEKQVASSRKDPQTTPVCTPSSNNSAIDSSTVPSPGFPDSDTSIPSAGKENSVGASCDKLARSFGLTNREREILYLLAQGMNASAIAEELTVSTSTVKTHMRNVYAKLGIHTQNELLLMVHRG